MRLFFNASPAVAAVIKLTEVPDFSSPAESTIIFKTLRKAPSIQSLRRWLYAKPLPIKQPFE